MSGLNITDLQIGCKNHVQSNTQQCLCFNVLNENILGRADVELHHAMGKIAANAVYTYALLCVSDTHSTKGEKVMICRMSDLVNDCIICFKTLLNYPMHLTNRTIIKFSKE